MSGDDIIPLRHSYALSMVGRISELEAEVERLRAAGDALAEMVAVRLPLEGDWPDYVVPYLRAWQEARRG